MIGQKFNGSIRGWSKILLGDLEKKTIQKSYYSVDLCLGWPKGFSERSQKTINTLFWPSYRVIFLKKALFWRFSSNLLYIGDNCAFRKAFGLVAEIECYKKMQIWGHLSCEGFRSRGRSGHGDPPKSAPGNNLIHYFHHRSWKG